MSGQLKLEKIVLYRVFSSISTNLDLLAIYSSWFWCHIALQWRRRIMRPGFKTHRRFRCHIPLQWRRIEIRKTNRRFRFSRMLRQMDSYFFVYFVVHGRGTTSCKHCQKDPSAEFSNYTFSSLVRDLGIILDQALTFAPHLNRLSRDCFYQLRQLRTVARSLSPGTAVTLVHSFITIRLTIAYPFTLVCLLFAWPA